MSIAKLSGKVALVAGGARGIGAAIVRRLVSGGASVVFTHVSSAQKARAPNRGISDQYGV
ncbi:SDR family NAD(P)-dependent oxidoreductase [Stutzerimonas xanthomarina]|uniref:SDR family NAD(P)-dependent oxidoreductase n=1 Tax=Stutzerimonas xanthomarina TaxID=271420 RepID=A0A427EAR6_9GAMM|nr:SDR family NAD(P)-dependent oxidoreductase [Stutzerimonas stutzeri]RRV13519.1 SDR family NAD(P)-dependent oxidoreductase [Stutzerimonas xanthomarina]